MFSVKHIYLLAYWVILSSPEHEVLNVSCWDQSYPGICHRQLFALNDNSFYTTVPIFNQTPQECSEGGPLQKFLKELDPSKNMTTRLIVTKDFFLNLL